MDFRLSLQERSALKSALSGFRGEVFLFGSRLNPAAKGGDIDIMLKSKEAKLFRDQITVKFLHHLEQKLDVVVYDERSPFCLEIIKHAKPLDPASL